MRNQGRLHVRRQTSTLGMELAPRLELAPVPGMTSRLVLWTGHLRRGLALLDRPQVLSESIFMRDVWFGGGIKSLKSKDLSPPVASVKPKVCLGQFYLVIVLGAV